ncbi:MAG: arginine--tRNA ligase [Actinobacteria bacterium]|nr:arginine--tRNA ligase [Actinomycetota bacterium]
MITDHLAELLASALTAASADGIVSGDLPEPFFERPRNRQHGDWATNVALQAAKGGNPRPIAEALVERLPPSDLVERVDVAGPGFLNFHLAPVWLHDVVFRAASDPDYGRSDRGGGKKINVEYVSANPTGPMTVVLGRHAAVGDAISRLLEAAGYAVTREYYFNDAGRQVWTFARSVQHHYLKHFGVDIEFPDDGYRGGYVAEIAAAIAEEHRDVLVALPDDERLDRIRVLAANKMIPAIRESLEAFGTTFDVWFSEARLHESGELAESIERLRREGLVEDRDGAVFFLSTRFGDDKDRVVIRSDGTPTYFAADIAYVVDKFRRGFDHLIYLWGADHHGTIARFLGAVEGLGHDRDRVEVRLVQIVTLSSGGKTVRASKRAGLLVPLEELVQEVGRDAARYTFLTRSIDVPLDFDIELAKEQAPENPVYYVQYAHARICSILRKADEEGHSVDAHAALVSLTHESEDTLMRKLASYEEIVPDSAEMRAPQRITRFLEELAADFSAFYRDCRVITDEQALTKARLVLCVATKNVIASGLGLLGVTAPERM